MTDGGRYPTACGRIDAANAEDPRRVEDGGRSWPREVLYSRRMVAWVERLAPEASEELRLAARAQHLRRWTIPRSRFPEGRKGYLQWRETLKTFHADETAALLREAGYGEASVDKVRTLLRRKNLAADPEGQTLEDAACLVFLAHEMEEFAARTAEDKMVDILRKSWVKMSAAGREAAKGLDLGAREKALLERALES